MAKAKPKEFVEAKFNEAKVCEEMGLFAEALAVYKALYSEMLDQDDQLAAELETRIDKMQNLLVRNEQDGTSGAPKQDLSPKEISLFKKTLKADDDVSSVLDSAAAFKSLGLFKEAATELEKLIGHDSPQKKVIPDYIACCLKFLEPLAVVNGLERILGERKVKNEIKGEILYLSGQVLEKSERNELAQKVYKSALKFSPANTEIRKRSNAMAKTLVSATRYDYLINNDITSHQQLQQAVMLSNKMNKSVEFVLMKQFQVKKEDIAKSFELFYDCPFKEYDEKTAIPFELLGKLKKSFLLNDHWVPLSWDKDTVEILLDDPKDLNKYDNIKALINSSKFNFSVAIREDIESYIHRFFDGNKFSKELGQENDFSEEFDLIPDVSFEEEEDFDEENEVDEGSSQVVKLVDQCIIAAYRKNASDIHVEPSNITRTTNIRFRIDGVCQDYLKVPNSMARAILSRIKIMGNLDIAERRLPQDGKIRFRRKGVPAFELRIATLPTQGGFEDVVLRILASAGAMSVDDMGLNDRNYDEFLKILQKPYGLILVVGPTGSGKTTSLHAALHHINKPGIKIWTAEDPIEITQAGLRQVEVKPKIGLNFARVMRAFLRADPDVIMIGEMRDEETARIGIEASLTGHLVFSTLHTNSAPETVTRLLDMGLNPLNFSDAFLGVMAQRLLRKLCTHCREPYDPKKSELIELKKDYGEEAFEKSGIDISGGLKLYRVKGCSNCSNTGYSGRTGIHELMMGTKSVKMAIKRADSTEKLLQLALDESMTTLRQDGIRKIFKGITDIDEVRRVCIE